MTNPITAKHYAKTPKEIQFFDIKEFLKKKRGKGYKIKFRM